MSESSAPEPILELTRAVELLRAAHPRDVVAMLLSLGVEPAWAHTIGTDHVVTIRLPTPSTVEAALPVELREASEGTLLWALKVILIAIIVGGAIGANAASPDAIQSNLDLLASLVVALLTGQINSGEPES